MWIANQGREPDSGSVSPWPPGWPLSCAPARASSRCAAAAKRSGSWRTTTSCAAPSSVSSKRLGTRSSRQRTASRRSRRSARRRACGSCFRISSCPAWEGARCTTPRSEEHTSELQSRLHLVCRLLLEKKNNKYVLKLDQLFLHTAAHPGRDASV